MFNELAFLIAQLIFVPEYLKTTNICTNKKASRKQMLGYFLISPFCVYIYVNILFIALALLVNNEIFKYVTLFADAFIILSSLLAAKLYQKRSRKIDKWDGNYYASIYVVFFLLEMAFTCVYTTMYGSIIFNILLPLVTIYTYDKQIVPLFKEIKNGENVAVPRSLFTLPVIAEVFFLFRSCVVIYLTLVYPEISLDDVASNLILTIFSILLIGFIFLSTRTILRNIKNKQDIIREADKNQALTSDMIKALVQTIDAKDAYTNGHSIRVADYSKMIAKRAFWSDKTKINKIYNIALLHDIGKISIADSIINKTGKLTDEEYEIIKSHTTAGAKILEQITSYPDLIYGAKYHHERYDGKGYPCGLQGEEIPEIAALIAVADAYDAMTSKRSYRNALPQEIVRSEIEKNLGTQFNPKFGKIMLEIMDEDKEYKLKQA